MTIPNSITLPSRKNIPSQSIDDYQVTLVNELQRMYSNLARVTNGDIKSSYYTQKEQWIPYLYGVGTAGSFTYNHCIGWAFRQGLLVDVWGDVSWSAIGGAIGNLYVELPYAVANSEQMPFVGTVQPSSVTFGAGQTALTINAIPNTNRGEFWGSGTGIATANLSVPATGRLIFHLRYLGVRDE